ncbi:tRNA-specific 2-thiouridylase [Schizophyllum commune]
MLPRPGCARSAVKAYMSGYCRRYCAASQVHTQPKKGDKVVVGMSGGVDSSVTAKLMLDQGYDVSGIYMRNWDTRDESGTDEGCEWKKDWKDVQRVCDLLSIPCKMVDLSKEYWNRVFQPSLDAWASGVTPNPDVLCNRHVKFGALHEHLGLLAAEDTWFATGHYARKSWSNGRPTLLAGLDSVKDQSYYLASIRECNLRPALFPLGAMHKSEVKRLAHDFKLPVADRKESMGICFVGQKGNFKEFLSKYLEGKPGSIRDIETGEELGGHEGLWNYTVGERARIPNMLQRWYVADKDTVNNIVYVVPGPDHPALFKQSMSADQFDWIWTDAPPEDIDRPDGLEAYVKFIYRMSPTRCTVRRQGRGVQILLDEPMRDVSLGQVAVIYHGDERRVLGCGTITHTES